MARDISKLLNDLRKRRISTEKVLRHIKDLPYKDIGFAKIDCHRRLRRGFPEVIYGQGKSKQQIVRIAKRIIAHDGILLVTRTDRVVFKAIKKICPKAQFNELAGTISYIRSRPPVKKGLVLVITAGTSDIPVAEEARVTSEIMGCRVETLYDVGVAGLHRVLDNRDALGRASVIIVVAGMEGALASVVSGLVSKPVISVPTSVGYGASFSGLAPLLTMMNCCSPGVAVVNIDNGFGAGYFAGLITQ